MRDKGEVRKEERDEDRVRWGTQGEGGKDSEGERERRGKLRHSPQTLQAAPSSLSKSGRRVLFLAPRKPSEAAGYFPSTSLGVW